MKPKQTAATKAGLNLGPVTSAALAEIGVYSQADLQALGWEEVLVMLVEQDPRWANLNLAYGLIGALEGVDWRKIDPVAKAQAQKLVRSLKKQKRRDY